MGIADGFASGFAQGFVRSRERSEDRQNEQENTMFKYKMETLMQSRTKREKKKEQEVEYARQAKDLANQMGDADFAPIAHEELRNGVGYEAVQKRIQDGMYAPNTDYKTPDQTIKVPTAVSQPLNTNPSANAPGTLPTVSDDVTASTTPTPVAYKTPIGAAVAAGKMDRQSRLDKKVDSRINQIDPTLLTEKDDDNTSSTTTMENSKYIFKPKNEMKIGDYPDALYELSRAKQTKDPVRIRDAQLKVQAHEQAITQKSLADQRAQGKDAKAYLTLNDDGTLGKQFTGVVHGDELWDTSNPINPQPVKQHFIQASDDDIKRLNTLQDNFGKQSANYNIQATSMVGALDASSRLTKLLLEDRNSGTYAYQGIQLAKRIGGELEAGYTALTSAEQEINRKIENNDLNGLEGLIAQHAKEVDEFYQKSLITPANDIKAQHAALYNSLKLSAAYQLAQANADDGKLSDRDIKMALDQVTGGGTEDPDSVMRSLHSTSKAGYLKLRTMSNRINKDPSITGFETRLGVKTGLTVDDLPTIINSMNVPEEQKHTLLGYAGSLDQDYNEADMKARLSLNAAQNNPETPGNLPTNNEEETGYPQVNSKADRDKLAPGAKYIAPDGTIKVKK